MLFNSRFGLVVLSFILFSAQGVSAFANTRNSGNIPQPPQNSDEVLCLDDQGNVLPVDNERVLELKKATKPSFMTRAHVEGRVVAMYADRTGHSHFSIQLGEFRSESLEVVYNQDFGDLPDHLTLGSLVHACGDYITLRKGKGRGTSPDGAIIHWVHGLDPARPTMHKPSFVRVDYVFYGNALQK